MSADTEIDRLEGAPHPRETLRLFGHQTAESAILDAYRHGRLHHAWLLAGPEGIGKATLAYRLGRFLLAYPTPESIPANQIDLSVSSTHPVVRRVAVDSHPDLVVLRRGPDPDVSYKLSTVIKVNYVRRVGAFFAATAGEGGWRICIVDSADDLNKQSGNALLKLLEEPPERSIFLLPTHRPGALLPTIRSRCRLLSMKPLDDAAMRQALASFDSTASLNPEPLVRAAGGSVRHALAMAAGAEMALYERISAILEALPAVDWAALHALTDSMRLSDDTAFDLMLRLIRDLIERHMRMQGSASARMLAPWAELWEKVETGATRVRAYNLDRKPFIFSVFGRLAELVVARP